VASLVLTIDTEPDLPKRRQSTHSSLRNIPELLALQRRIPDLKLTLLVTQSVVEDPACLRVLEQLQAEHGAEIGAHLHPEDTPPFVNPSGPRQTSLMRLPPELRAAKLDTLMRALEARFPRPTSYRAGRWKLSPEDFGLLREQGILVDSTVTPYVSWRLEHGPDFSGARPEPYRLAGGLWEVPVTIGLNRWSGLGQSGLGRRYLQLFSHPLNSLKFPLDLLWGWGRPISPVWLRPTYTPLGALEKLGRWMLRRSADPILNMMFHSNELVVGGRPFIREQADVERIVERIIGACRYFRDQLGVESATLTEAVRARESAAARPAPALGRGA
jgi:hypothetical protein